MSASCKSRALSRLARATPASSRYPSAASRALVLGLLVLSSLSIPGEENNGGLPEAASKVNIKLVKQREGNLIRFFVHNMERARVTATFDLGLVNMKGSTRFPCTLTFPPGQTIEAFSLSPIRENEHWNYSLTNHCTLGNSRAVHDDNYIYSLPYEPGRSFVVSQAFGGSFSHSGPEKYAIDWTMPEATSVLAARGGVVVGLKRDSARGGPDRRFENEANYILIEHSDGTIANYAHLMHDGVRVKVGQRVTTGELIGLSGNTGFSSGPHLHLSVFKPLNGKSRESIAIRFSVDGRDARLIQGQLCANANTPLLTKVDSRGARD